MASGREMISACPSACTHSPKKLSVKAHSEACGRWRRFLVLTAVSRVLISTRPSSSTVHVTGDNCGLPSDREVARTARWWTRRKSAARPVSTSGAVETRTPAQLVLVHDGAGVAVTEPVLVGQPVRALFAAQEGWTRFQAGEPLREFSSGDGRDARDQVFMRFQGVVQSQLAPPGVDACSVEPASRPGSWQPPGADLK